MEEKNTSYYNELALRAQTDELAFSELYEYFFPRVYNFLGSMQNLVGFWIPHI